jgi:hypothetical protein
MVFVMRRLFWGISYDGDLGGRGWDGAVYGVRG